MMLYPEKRRAPSADNFATWFRPAGSSDETAPYEVQAEDAITITIDGTCALVGSTDGVQYVAACDTAGNPIAGPVGAAHLDKNQAFRFLRPDNLQGRCEICVRDH